jgi:hypothetical protein
MPESGRSEAPHLHQTYANRKPLVQRNLALAARIIRCATTKPMVRCIGELRHKFHTTVTLLRIFGAAIEIFAFLAEEELELQRDAGGTKNSIISRCSKIC